MPNGAEEASKIVQGELHHVKLMTDEAHTDNNPNRQNVTPKEITGVEIRSSKGSVGFWSLHRLAGALGDDQSHPVFAGHSVFGALPRDSGICWLPRCVCLSGLAGHILR